MSALGMASWFILFGFGSITGRIAGFGGWLDFVLFYGLYTIVMVMSFLVVLQFDISESYMSLYPVIFLTFPRLEFHMKQIMIVSYNSHE